MITVFRSGETRVLAMFDGATATETPIEETDTGVRVAGRMFADRTLADFDVRDDLTNPGDHDPADLILDDGALIPDPAIIARRAVEEAEARTTMARARHRAVDAERDRRIAAGMTYTIQDNGADVFVPLGDQGYLDNLRALVTQATALLATGDTTTTINIGNATDDGDHDLTAEQMIAFGQTILGRIQALYRAARDHRAELTRIAADTPGEREDVADALDAYDFTSTKWPGAT